MTDHPSPPHPAPGAYRHFKGGRYTVLMTARHSETEEWLVVYRAEAGQGLWVRPLASWSERVIVDGVAMQRFAPDPSHS